MVLKHKIKPKSHFVYFSLALGNGEISIQNEDFSIWFWQNVKDDDE